MKRIFTFVLIGLLWMLGESKAMASLQLASPITVSKSDIAYKEAFSVSATVSNQGASDYTGQLGLALYDAGKQLVTVLSPQYVVVNSGSDLSCQFHVDSWSELMASQYHVSICYMEGEWKQVAAGGYNALESLMIHADPCNGNVIYECDFEQNLLGWTFANATGINTGFTVGTAMAYEGQNALYISSDGGVTAGYAQDNNKGYVSVAYKKVYLEAGNYELRVNMYTNLQYMDIDQDQCMVALTSANNTIEPLDYFDSWPLYDYITYISNWYEDGNWYEPSSNGLVKTSGWYYIAFYFMANDHDAREIGVVMDNIKIIKIDDISYRETLDGVLFEWGGGYPEYRIDWHNSCGVSKAYTITENSYLIPYTQLRDAIYDESWFQWFYVTPICENGQQANQFSINFIVKTEPFPADTCPAVPHDLTAVNTDQGVQLSWKGNPGTYDLKYGREDRGCNFTKQISGLQDSQYVVSFNPSSGLVEDCENYFFVRGICEGDTSIWQRVSLCVKGPEACSSSLSYAKPCEFYAQNTSKGIMLTWKGNAQKYEIECRSEDKYYSRGRDFEAVDSNFVRFTASESSYTIPYHILPDTLYHFRVRAVCEKDTSFWTDYISAYNVNFGDYVIPFYDLCGPNTECTYGSYYDPYSNKKTLDYRQKDWDQSYNSWNDYGYRHGVYGWWGWNYTYYRSRHTICFEGETDPRCDNLLSTVPPGEKYSMRLGNWYNGEGESVTFTHKIDSGYPLILLLKYAVVLQDPSHPSEENPHFTLEILDENNVPLDPICWYADFAADKYAEGWKIAVNEKDSTKEEFRNVVWKDWTTIGVNLTELSKDGDKIIKIRLTTKDCTRGQHYGYAYFTLQCVDGEMQGVSCGERPNHFEVAEGFKYRWYLMDDISKTQVSDSNVFVVQPTDTNSYYVDMISLENEDCYYTLKAYTLPRLPRPQATFTHAPHDCINEVVINNSSYVYKKMLDGTEQYDGRVPIDSIVWDFGPYGISTEIEPQLIIPNEGDTFNVSLRVVANGCAETATYTLDVPAIGSGDSYTYRYMCEGGSYTYQGVEYTKPDTYVVDRVSNSYGCDSTAYLVLDFINPETIYLYDTVCFNMLPYEFYGQSYQQSGTYQHTLFAQSGCDSVYYVLDLYVYEKLSAELNAVSEICSGDLEFDLSYKTFSDQSLEFVITFSDMAKSVGFVDTVGHIDNNGLFSIYLPKDVRPDTYAAQVSIDNHGCEIVSIPLNIPVLYSRNIITQRWNDFLGIKNAQYNGGYIFSDYQWYLNDQPISGHTATQIYTDGELLDFEGEYRVLLTREDDGKSIMTCAFTPTYFYDTDLLQMCTFVMSSETVPAKISQNASMYIYDMSGFCVAHHTLCTGDNFITMPSSPGVYMAKVIYGNGKLDVIKLVVK